MPSNASTQKTDGTSAAGPADAAALAARFRLRVTTGDVIAIGPGKISLLEAISATGSISAAARSLGMSYRRAWLLLDEMNRMMREPVTESARGGALRGGSQITELGRELIETYRRIEQKAAASCAEDIEHLLALVSR
jgi:molybdate transport system regulatory protein